MSLFHIPADLLRPTVTNLTGLVVEVTALPSCDLCKMYGIDDSRPARFDGRSNRLRQWGYFCASHAKDHLIALGTGCGQMLVTPDELAQCRTDFRNYTRLFYGG